MSKDRKRSVKELTAYICFPFWVPGYEHDSERFNTVIGLLNVGVFFNPEDAEIPYFKLIPVVNKMYTDPPPQEYALTKGRKQKIRDIIKECDVVFIAYEEHTTSFMLYELHTTRSLDIRLIRLPADLLDSLS